MGKAVEAYCEWGAHEGKQFHSRYLLYNAQMRKYVHNIPIANITPGFITQLKGVLLKSPVARTKSEIVQDGKVISKERKILAPGTVKGLFMFVRAAINRAIYNGLWKGVNPFSTKEGWTMPLVNNKRLRFLTREEARALLDDLQVRHPQLHDMVLLSLRTGLRPTEIFRLRGEDIDAASHVLYVLAKGAKRIPVKVPEDIIAMLLAYGRKPHEHIFMSDHTGQPFNRTPQCFQTAVNKLGLAPEDGNPLHAVTLHTMRHTFASWLAQSGKVSLMELQKLLRHESINMTMRYAHLFPGQPSEKLAIISKKALVEARKLEMALAELAKKRQRQKASFTPIVQTSPQAAYFAHYENIRTHLTIEDFSRVDAMIALRMRANGHSHKAVFAAIQACAPQIRTGAEKRRNWPAYAERTTNYAFGFAGDRDLQRNARYLELWRNIEMPSEKALCQNSRLK